MKGHNYFIEGGLGAYNTFDHNLVISSLQAFNMLQSDIYAASFWISNPLNNLINNIAAGGDSYGFRYNIDSSTDEKHPNAKQLG